MSSHARPFSIILGTIEDAEDDGDVQEIPLPNVKASVLSKVCVPSSQKTGLFDAPAILGCGALSRRDAHIGEGSGACVRIEILRQGVVATSPASLRSACLRFWCSPEFSHISLLLRKKSGSAEQSEIPVTCVTSLHVTGITLLFA